MPSLPPALRRHRPLMVGIPIVAAVAVVVVLVGLSVAGAGGRPAADDPVLAGSGAEVSAALSGLTEVAGGIGSEDAPVTVTEFADLRCPICAAWSVREMPQLIAAQVRPGRIRFERRIWPILGPDSVRAAIGAAAAGRQDRLMAFSEVWYRNQRSESEDYASDRFMVQVAEEAGLDVGRYREDLARISGTADQVAAIEPTSAAAKRLGLTGTPAFLITGPDGAQQVIRSYAGADEIAEAVAQALAR